MMIEQIIDVDGGWVIQGDCVEVMDTLRDDYVDAIITDPPYELKFMGKSWDQSGVSFQPETWAACLRVLKPGGHLVVFGGTRTHHRMWVVIEDAGFELRDTLMWLYGTGFPKSLDVSKAIDKAAGVEHPHGELISGNRSMSAGKYTRPKMAVQTDAAREWDGWGTALKPAWEPILLARKPLSEKTVAANVLKWGTGALNIDATRISTKGEIIHTPKSDPAKRKGVVGSDIGFSKSIKEKMAAAQKERTNRLGRWPANLIHDGSDEAVAGFPRTKSGKPSGQRASRSEESGIYHSDASGSDVTGYGDEGSASRFFYCAKASRAERERELAGRVPCIGCGQLDTSEHEEAGRTTSCMRNRHPTVKPIALMRWLVRLVTPSGGWVLDPFCGSGTTLVAAIQEECRFIGIDMDAGYCEIALGRIEGEV